MGLVRFSAERDLCGGVYGTPWAFFRPLDEEFGFTLDVCALPENAKCACYFTPEQDGLGQSWRGVCWCNPPYGRGMDAWVRKARLSAREGATVVCLLPVRTDVAWWHDEVLPYAEVRYIRGRIRFEGMASSPTFGCALVIFRPSA